MSTVEDIRRHTTRTLLEALRRHGSLSRTALAHETGFSRTTVASVLDDLATDGLILEHPDRSAERRTRGRPPTLVRLHPSAGLTLGIAIDRDNVRVALVDLGLTTLAQRSTEFEPGTPPETVLALALELIDDTLTDIHVDEGQLIGAAIGLPGPVDPRTGTPDPRTLSDWAPIDVHRVLAAQLDVPVTIDKLANLEALAEAALGAGQGVDTIVYVKASWGIGGAIIRRGQILRGRRGYAGEFGHINVRDDGPECRCGGRGCLEATAGGPALQRALEPARGSIPTLHEIVESAIGGDVGATRVLTDAGAALGRALTTLCLALNPGAIVVGGELGAPGSPLLDSLHASLRHNGFPAVMDTLRVLPASVGSDAGPLGAAGLVVRSEDAARHLAGHLNRL